MFQFVFVFALVSLSRNWEPIFVFTRASAVSQRIPRSHWDRWIRFCGLIGSAESASAVSLRPLNPLPWIQWDCESQTFLDIVLCCKLPFCVKIVLLKFFDGLRSLIETAEAASAVSLKPPNPLPWPHWNCGSGFCCLILTAEADNFKRLYWFSWRFWIHMRNGFSPWIRALGGVDWWKKPRVENRDTVPLKGQCHEIFNPRFFFIKLSPLGPWFTG
jgi:hypothetical protein